MADCKKLVLTDNQHARALARFLEMRLGPSIRLIAHLRPVYQITVAERDGLFNELIRRTQAHYRLTLAWVRGDEHSPLRHVHALLIAPQPLDGAFIADCWRQQLGTCSKKCAHVESYRRGGGGLAYAMKGIDLNRCDVSFSDNIAYFGLTNIERRLKPAQRRQLRRVRRQFDNTDVNDFHTSGVTR